MRFACFISEFEGNIAERGIEVNNMHFKNPSLTKISKKSKKAAWSISTMKIKYIRIIQCSLFISLFFAWTTCFAYQEPPLLDVSKPSGGTVYYVDASVSTSGNGLSEASAWKTLADADGRVGSGAIVKVKAGTYAAIDWNSSSGSSGNEVVIEAYGDGNVYIQGESRISSSYIIFDGGPNRNIIFRRAGSSGIRVVRIKGNNITLWRVQVLGPTGTCSVTDNCGVLIKGYATPTPRYTRIFNSVFDNCSHKAIYVSASYGGEIRNNIISNTGNSGLQVNPHESGCEINGLIISGNVFYDNGFCSGMPGHNLYVQATSSGAGLQGLVIYNNRFWGSNRSGVHIGMLSGQLSGDLKILNNTFYDNDDYGISFDSSVPDNQLVLINNIANGNGVSQMNFRSVAPKQNVNNLTSSPSYASTNPSDTNFLKLSSSSTNAIDQGSDLSSEGITLDAFGNSRLSSGNFDIGAHEYNGSAPSNNALQKITTLQVVSSTP